MNAKASLAVILLPVLAACAAEARPPGLYARHARYVLAVDAERAPAAPGGGAALFDGAGNEVVLTRAFFVQASAALVDCEGVGGDVWDEVEVALRELLLPGRARAGHGDDADPSAAIAPTYVDLLAAPGARSELVLAERAFDETRYCRLHHLVAMAYDAEDVIGAPAGVDAALVSLVIEGAWRAPGHDAWAPLAVRSTLSFGALSDLPDVVTGDLAGDRADVTITRALDALLAEVDLATASDDDVARQVLRNLVTHAEVRVHVASD